MKSYFCTLLVILISVASLLSDVNASPNADSKLHKVELKTEKNFAVRDLLSSFVESTNESLNFYDNVYFFWENEGKRLLSKLLDSQGYYSHSINVLTKNGNKNFIILKIDGNDRYTINTINIAHANDSNQGVILPDLTNFSLKVGQYAIAENVINAENEIKKYIEGNNCLLLLDVTHEVILNHFDKNIEILFIVKAGHQTTINDVIFNGADTIDTKYLKKLIEFKPGQCFKNSYVQKYQDILQNTGLFFSIIPTILKDSSDENLISAIFDLKEKKYRTFKLGLNYSTSVGIGTKLSLENKNFFGQGEQIVSSVVADYQEQNINLNYIKPFFKRDDQNLELNLKLGSNKYQAFENTEKTISTLIKRDIFQDFVASFGIRLSKIDITKPKNITQDTLLLSVPLTLSQDTRDNVWQPTKGYIFQFDSSAIIPLFSSEGMFFKNKISATKYFAIPTKQKTIIAVNAAMGYISMDDVNKIMHTERFFLGGSNSLRGYEEQLVSDLDPDNIPVGGQSFFRTSIELRHNITENIGVIGFLDSGFAYQKTSDWKNKTLLHGVGVGLRYMTNFGPIRLDVGIPATKRDSVDKSLQFYFGIGQAF